MSAGKTSEINPRARSFHQEKTMPLLAGLAIGVSLSVIAAGPDASPLFIGFCCIGSLLCVVEVRIPLSERFLGK